MNLPFHLGGIPDGTEAVYRCEFDHESNSYVEANDGDSACRWNSISGLVYWKPWDDSTDYQFRVRAAAAIGEDVDWDEGEDDEDANQDEGYEPDSGLFGDY